MNWSNSWCSVVFSLTGEDMQRSLIEHMRVDAIWLCRSSQAAPARPYLANTAELRQPTGSREYPQDTATVLLFYTCVIAHPKPNHPFALRTRYMAWYAVKNQRSLPNIAARA